MIQALAPTIQVQREWPRSFWPTVILFWIFTYAVLSYRTELLLGDAFHLFTARRVLATTFGAAIYAAVLWRIVSPAGRWAARPLLVIATVLPASLILLSVRLVLDRVLGVEPLPLQTNIGWVLAWAGYFGLWVSGALALTLGREPMAVPVQAAQALAEAEPRAADRAVQAETWSWLIDVLAEELARVPQADRAVILQRLEARAGYEMADELGAFVPGSNERVRLIRELAARL